MGLPNGIGQTHWANSLSKLIGRRAGCSRPRGFAVRSGPKSMSVVISTATAPEARRGCLCARKPPPWVLGY